MVVQYESQYIAVIFQKIVIIVPDVKFDGRNESEALFGLSLLRIFTSSQYPRRFKGRW